MILPQTMTTPVRDLFHENKSLTGQAKFRMYQSRRYHQQRRAQPHERPIPEKETLSHWQQAGRECTNVVFWSCRASFFFYKKVIITVHGGLAQKASVCLLRGRKKKHVGCIIDGETMEVQHKSYRSEGARIEGIGVCLGWLSAGCAVFVVYIA